MTVSLSSSDRMEGILADYGRPALGGFNKRFFPLSLLFCFSGSFRNLGCSCGRLGSRYGACEAHWDVDVSIRIMLRVMSVKEKFVISDAHEVEEERMEWRTRGHSRFERVNGAAVGGADADELALGTLWLPTGWQLEVVAGRRKCQDLSPASSG